MFGNVSFLPILIVQHVRFFLNRLVGLSSDAVRVIATKQGDQVLLVMTVLGPGVWMLPGGGIHKNELAEDAARREFFEETHLQCGALTSCGSYDLGKRGPAVHIFKTTEFTGALRTSFNFEILKCEWFGIETLPQKMYPRHREAIQRYG